MALTEYRKLCPNSGHVLSPAQRDALESPARAAGRAPTVRCDACGRIVAVCPDPGTGRTLLYSMHRKDGKAAAGKGAA